MKSRFLFKFAIVPIISLIFFSSCGNNAPTFTIEGNIANADSTILYLERRSLSETQIIDSIRLDKTGSFKFSEAALDYPEFYLLKLNDQTINIAVDSTETIKIGASKTTFATDYTIDGSGSSLKIKNVVFSQHKLSQTLLDYQNKYNKKEISSDEYVSVVQDAIEEYKTKAKDIIFSDHKNLAAYFALFQKVDSYLIFDPYDKKDLIAFQSVATIWDQYYAASPRAAHLKNFTLAALAEVRKMAQQEKTIKQLEEKELSDQSTHYEIDLPDLNGEKIKLSSLTGKVVILDFTAYQTDYSPAHNIMLNNVYAKYKPNVEIYQVSFDSDTHAWRNTAVNLPWISVKDDHSLTSDLIMKYNIQGFPTTFLINKKGEIVKRILLSDNLSSEVQKLL